MALQGTLDTFSLPDVLRLLATTGKTGCLHLDGDRGRGRVWLDEGTLVAAAADRAADDAPIDEVVFEMLRFDRGNFSFAVDERSPNGEPADLEATLRRAGQLLDEWRELEAVVPSLNHKVAMAPELTVEQVTIDAERWQALVAIAGGRPVGELGDALGQGELSITRTVSDLVELGIAVVQPPETSRPSSSSRRNVTDIGSRRAEEAGRRSTRREAASGTEGMPRSMNWSRTSDGGGAEADTAEHPGRSLYRGDGADDGQPRTPAPTKLPSRSPGGAQGAGTVTPPSGRPPVSPGVPTPPSGNAKADVAPQARSRSTGSGSRSSRSRSRTTTPSTNGNGNAVPLPTGPNRNGQLPTGPNRNGQLPTGPGLVTGPLATAPELSDDTGPGALPHRPLPTTPPGGVRSAQSSIQTGPLPIPDPARGPLLPPTLDTGRLGPSPMPTDTGQIPAVSASSLPPDLSWAAEDNELPIAPPMAAGQGGPPPAPLMAPPAPAPGPRTAPSRLLTPPSGRPVSAPSQPGDPAPHVVAMSPEARTAVEMTVGRAGGGQGPLQMAGATQEQIMGRGQLLQFLSTVRS